MAGIEAPLVPPLVVADGLDLSFFDSEAELRSEIEPWFANESYRAFDSEGHVLELVADPPVVKRRILFGLLGADNSHQSTLHVRRSANQQAQPTALAVLLREWLEAVSEPADPDADLPTLLARATAVDTRR